MIHTHAPQQGEEDFGLHQFLLEQAKTERLNEYAPMILNVLKEVLAEYAKNKWLPSYYKAMDIIKEVEQCK